MRQTDGDRQRPCTTPSGIEFYLLRVLRVLQQPNTYKHHNLRIMISGLSRHPPMSSIIPSKTPIDTLSASSPSNQAMPENAQIMQKSS